MNPNEPEIERLLRRGPKSSPPAGLRDELAARVTLLGGETPPSMSSSLVSKGWLHRWWPALVPAAASLVCVLVWAFQQMEIQDLEESIRTLSTDLVPAETATASAPLPAADKTEAPEVLNGTEPSEIARLKELATQLTAEVLALEQVQRENEALRTKPNVPATLTPEELDALVAANERAMSISCINNLKQFGLAVRLWALDNNDASPPTTLSMSNELSTPKILVCPADTNRIVAKSWETFSSANCSYEYLTPSATNAEHEPTRVLSRCPVHGHIGLCDGSVQSEVAKKHPEWFKQRDAKLYLEP